MWEHPYSQWPLFLQQFSFLTPPFILLPSLSQATACVRAFDESQNGPLHATGSHSPDHSHNLCRLTKSKAGRPAGAQNTSRPRQDTNIIHSFIHSLLISGWNTKQEVVTLFHRMATLPRTYGWWRSAILCLPSSAATVNATASGCSLSSWAVFRQCIQPHRSPQALIRQPSSDKRCWSETSSGHGLNHGFCRSN